MRILWVTAQQLPFVADELKIKKWGFGGWIMNMVLQLKELPDVHIGIAMSYPKVNRLKKEVDNITCYVVEDPGGKSISEGERDWIISDFQPDIIHVEGSEFPIQNMFTKSDFQPVILSLQGILSGYEAYQYGCLPIADYMYSGKEKNRISSWILYFKKHLKYENRISMETETIANVRYLTGRTFWDRAHSYFINGSAQYFICNRILRPLFYQKKWSVNQCEKHAIFVGNGYSPLKGLHFVIDAVGYLKREFPDVKLYVAGVSPIETNKKSVKYYGYSNIIKKKIKKLKLEENIIFLGALQEEEMTEYMCRARAFVLPSLIENSPNTLGEAMLMGVPCVVAYAGGASDMATDETECLYYRSNDPVLCAWQIKRVFESRGLAEELSQNAQKKAAVTHNPSLNRDALMSAYRHMLEENTSIENEK